jgi:hypothetical protein
MVSSVNGGIPDANGNVTVVSLDPSTGNWLKDQPQDPRKRSAYVVSFWVIVLTMDKPLLMMGQTGIK